MWFSYSQDNRQAEEMDLSSKILIQAVPLSVPLSMPGTRSGKRVKTILIREVRHAKPHRILHLQHLLVSQ